MPRFAVRFQETYSKLYYVEAENFDDACEKLEDAMMNEEVDAPEDMWDSEYIDVTEAYIEDLKNDDLLDVK